MKYIIGTGWCDRDTKESWARWSGAVRSCSSPEAVVMVDSTTDMGHSTPPRMALMGVSLETIRMTQNFGPGYGLPKSAATRQIFLGAWYAYFNDADYFVWIEQDCLIKGKGIIEHIINGMDGDVTIGEWDHKYRVETCFMAFNLKELAWISEEYFSNPQDRPEKRFAMIDYSPFDFVGGRNRPLDWTQEFMYGHQMTPEEIKEYERSL